jgi:hypothetical protein
MNKWQIICPVAALLVVGMVMAVVATRGQRRGIIIAASSSIGHDLITVTNSSHLVRLGPHLRARLSELLGSQTHVAAVLPGDAPAPDGDGQACSRLVLTNNAGQRLLIRLRQADRSGMFDVVGFRSSSP